MAVYVDHARIPYRRMRMSHMIADTLDELLAMADAIGLDRRHLQSRKHPHFDVCESYRSRAIALGAKPVDRRELVRVMRRYRERHSPLSA